MPFRALLAAGALALSTLPAFAQEAPVSAKRAYLSPGSSISVPEGRAISILSRLPSCELQVRDSLGHQLLLHAEVDVRGFVVNGGESVRNVSTEACHISLTSYPYDGAAAIGGGLGLKP